MSHDASSADGARGDEDRDAGSPAGETRLPEQAATPGRTRMPVLVVTAALILVADLLTKIVVVATIEQGNPVYLIGDWLRLALVRNPGAAFSMATGMTWLLTLVAVGVVVAVVRMGRRLRSGWWALGLGLVLGGALGNLVDRFFRAPGVMQGHVVDFVAVGWWPVFNVADSAIVCGAVLLVALTLFGVEPNAAHRKADA